MKVIKAGNANEALTLGLQYLATSGVGINSRNGRTIEAPCPVTTMYTMPWNRVLISKLRDANPFFHLMESLWILAGRQDVAFLDIFDKRMKEYSDDGKVFNAAYGHRMRARWLDQLAQVIKILEVDPNSHQAVIQIWDNEDLGKKTKDKACIVSIVFTVRGEALDMTVNDRSNDILRGAYGANVVQLSMIMEYVAGHLGLSMGTYYQVTNSYHAYLDGPGGDLYHKLKDKFHTLVTLDEEPVRFIDQPNVFTANLNEFFRQIDTGSDPSSYRYRSKFFQDVVSPVWVVWQARQVSNEHALAECEKIQCAHWRLACQDYLENRIAAQIAKSKEDQPDVNLKQVGGTHYKNFSYQHWDFAIDAELPWPIGAATKYLTRWRKAKGTEDLIKSVHYLEKATQKSVEVSTLHATIWWKFSRQLPREERGIMAEILDGKFEAAIKLINDLINQNED